MVDTPAYPQSEFRHWDDSLISVKEIEKAFGALLAELARESCDSYVHFSGSGAIGRNIFTASRQTGATWWTIA